LPPDVHFYGYNAPKSILAGTQPQTPLGNLQCSSRLPSWNKGDLLLREGEGAGKGGERGASGDVPYPSTLEV